MKLYLIRHGETVDNVAGVYAGCRDSQLTNHGFEQAKRLGASFAADNVRFTHIFASPLSRAFRTAEAVRDAQFDNVASEDLERVEIVQVQELIERNYGAYEGRPYSTRKEWQRAESNGQDEYQGAPESTRSMAKRSDAFLDEHLLPLFREEESVGGDYTTAIVAHGMLLSHLWRRFLLRLPRSNLKIAPEIVEARGEIELDHLGGWSNTGFLELSIRKDAESQPQHTATGDDGVSNTTAAEAATLPTPLPPPLQAEGADVSVAPPHAAEAKKPDSAKSNTLSGYSTMILAIDSKKHVAGLKRQPGGIGSLANEQGQKKVDAFFKRRELT